MTSQWLPEHIEQVQPAPETTAWVVDPTRLQRMLADRWVWDAWPLLNPDATIARPFGRELWIAPSSPTDLAHPGDRHDQARLWLANANSQGTWTGEGALWEAEDSVGSREWAGCSIMDANTGLVTVYYTAAGVAGEDELTFIQRILGTRGRLNPHGDFTSIRAWEPHQELFVVPEEHYQPPVAQPAADAHAKALRHPSWFRDPRDGAQYLVFSASMAGAHSDADAAIGIAAMVGGSHLDWYVRPPLVTADGVARTLERPHLIERYGTYFLFATVHDRGFAEGVEAPHGLYGWSSDSLEGEWAPLNGSGLVLTNPAEEPAQMSSWLVLRDGWVISSAAYGGAEGRSLTQLAADDPDWLSDHYLGTLSTWTQLRLSRDGTHIVEQRYTPPLWD